MEYNMEEAIKKIAEELEKMNQNLILIAQILRAK